MKKNIKFYHENQNVYAEYTGSSFMVRTELICICVNESTAKNMKLAFFKLTEEERQELLTNI